ncbi:MAG: hypothetical protein LUD15_15600, partial [Bacteroides sp.]|nr:hypothetical protein [Bacteroides sp.]
LESFKTGRLKEILEVVNKDKDLDIQIRSNYLNVYYNGGNIAKIYSETSIQFDKFYFCLDRKKSSKEDEEANKKETEELKEKKNNLLFYFKKGAYELYFTEAKHIWINGSR